MLILAHRAGGLVPSSLTTSRRKLGALSKRSASAVPCIISMVPALFATVPARAGSDDDILPNQTGDDPTQPLGKIELLDRFTTIPGPGVAAGKTKPVDTNTPFARIEAPFQIAPQWGLAFRAEIPVVSTNGVTSENPSGQVMSGFGNVLTQDWLVYQIDPRWAVAAGAQAIAPTSTNGVASDAWEQVTGAVVRVMLPELSQDIRHF
jgi:hypothetical protein